MSEELTIRATFDADGVPIAFYPSDFWPNGYPETAIEITIAQYEELMAHQGKSIYINGEIVISSSPFEPTINDYRLAIQSLIEETAQSKQYDNAASLASYVASTVPAWAAQAQTFVAWRDAVWQYVYQQFEKFQLGLREQPSVADFLTEITPIDWNEQ